MFCAIALGALWHPLGVVHFLVCANRVLRWASKKLQKQFKTNGLRHFGGILFGRPTWTIRTTNAFPCSVRLVFHVCEAFPCSVGLIFLNEIAFPCRRRSICTRSAPSGGSELSCLDGSVWTGLSGPACLDPVRLDLVCLRPPFPTQAPASHLPHAPRAHARPSHRPPLTPIRNCGALHTYDLRCPKSYGLSVELRALVGPESKEHLRNV